MFARLQTSSSSSNALPAILAPDQGFAAMQLCTVGKPTPFPASVPSFWRYAPTTGRHGGRVVCKTAVPARLPTSRWKDTGLQSQENCRMQACDFLFFRLYMHTLERARESARAREKENVCNEIIYISIIGR